MTDASRSEPLSSLIAMQAKIASLPQIEPMTIVTGPHFLPGRAWLMREDGHLYAFIYEGDLDSLPMRVSSSFLGLDAIPVKTMDDPEARGVFMRGLTRMAASVEGGRS